MILGEREFHEKARSIREWIIRSLEAAGSGHTGGSLGLADIFTYLYFNEINHKPQDPHWPDRDILILSIGHVAPVLYAALAHAGYFPKEELLTLRKLGSRLQGHPGRDHGLPGVELSAGSLGQGIGVAVGVALARKMDLHPGRVFCVAGDGELQEGSVWEAAMAAAHYQLDNLLVIVDRNGVQIDGYTENVMKLEPLAAKWEAFGWAVIECNGNHYASIKQAFTNARTVKEKPTVILAKTVMGKGVREIEGDYRWHGKAPDAQQAQLFLEQIAAYYESLGK
ncbi:MAG: transketolase [Bacteroidales bacterium]|jgi:transketolase|nr:transketolase [Bacteroidales bacterium]NPV35259.1 transketolase [Bacteroidales bacterium]